jgi:hypothetical protein
VKPDTECPPGFRLQKGGPTESDRCVRIVMPDTPDPPQQEQEEEDDNDSNNGDGNGAGATGDVGGQDGSPSAGYKQTAGR